MALPWDAASLRADLSDTAEQATRVVAHKAQDLCAKDPLGCATKAIALGQTLDIAALLSPSQDTLRPDDLAPAWRGPMHTAARR